MGIGAVGLAEAPAPGLRIASPEHCRAVLPGEARVFDLFHDAEVFEYGHGRGKERFPDVFTREAFAFQQDDVEAVSGEQGGGGTASRPAAYHYHVGLFGLHL